MEPQIGTITKAQAAAITALALLGPLFGIATQVWGQALLLLGLSALLIFAPPRRRPDLLWCVIFTAILALSLTAFLPGHWFETPEWRRALVKDFRIELPDTLSPQPWLSVHAICLMFGGLVFALYLSTRTWSRESRRQAARWYVGGVVMLALVALISAGTGWRPPVWPKVLNAGDGFGIFPNRNQTANVFALAGIMATALAFDALGKRRRGGWFWVSSVLVLGWAIVRTSSRAGVLLFFGGIAAWVLLSLGSSRSSKRWSLAVAALALLVTGFIVFGGDSLERIQRFAQDERPDYRAGIHQDALRLSATAPWLGQGIGNFAPVFAMSRVASADQNRAIHPESDWLWLAVETGWPAVVLFALAVLLWLRKCLPMSDGTDRAMRAAAMVCGIAFVLHAFADVSGHRPGSAWPALFLAGLAMNSRRTALPSRWVAPVFRTAGLVLLLISAWWIADAFSERIGTFAPTPATVSRLRDSAAQKSVRGEYESAVLDAGEALRIAPLNADVYFQRALTRAAQGFSVWGAGWDFAKARYLEPRWARFCIEEGKAWAAAGQVRLAMDAWTEALRRAGSKGPEIYDEMLGHVRDRPGMTAALGTFSRTSPAFFLTYLRHVRAHERQSLIEQLIKVQPGLEQLSAAEKRNLFSIWFQGGDRDRLYSMLNSNPEWRREGWRWLAKIHAQRGNFRSACQVVRESSQPPVLPNFTAARELRELERIYRLRPDDISVGLELHRAQIAEGLKKDALATLKSLQEVRGCPRYVAYIEAGLREDMDDWEGAWKAWLRYGGRDFD